MLVEGIGPQQEKHQIKKFEPKKKVKNPPKVVYLPIQIVYRGNMLLRFKNTVKSLLEVSRKLVTGADGGIETVFTINVSNVDAKWAHDFYLKIYNHILVDGGNDFPICLRF